MQKNQSLPFERNRYYVGKLLTSADFQAEQAYNNQKRRFLNEIMYGSGIVCGLGVYSLDDLSIMVDSGVAIDGYGCEIALENALVKKLSAIDGFESLTTDSATLCLRYREEDVHPVYTVRGQQENEAYECNRIRESWELFLQDTSTVPQPFEIETEFLTSAVLYEDADYRITCTLPSNNCLSGTTRLEVTVERLSLDSPPLTFNAAIQTPAFLCEDGQHELIINFKEISPEEPITIHHWLVAQSTPAEDSALLADARAIQVRVGEEARPVFKNFLLKAAVVDLSAEEIIDAAVSSPSLESRFINEDFIQLAKINLQRTRSAYLIESIKTAGVRKYIRTTSTSMERHKLSTWFNSSAKSAGNTPANIEVAAPHNERFLEPIYATGTCDIPLGPNARRNQIALSDEIIHTLGPGTVYINVGSEYLAEDAKLGNTARNTIYGNTSLFAGQNTQLPEFESAVKVMNDRGSFQVAVRLLSETPLAVLTLRWVAISMPAGNEKTPVQKLAGKSIAAMQPTVVMATRESHFFNVRFKNMDPCTLTYELTEKDSGEITADGIYTSPGREGVFEIRISCADMPLISTYAYAVVKKKDAVQTEE